jgi:hypothetical protein
MKPFKLVVLAVVAFLRFIEFCYLFSNRVGYSRSINMNAHLAFNFAHVLIRRNFYSWGLYQSAFITPFSSSGIFSPLHPAPRSPTFPKIKGVVNPDLVLGGSKCTSEELQTAVSTLRASCHIGEAANPWIKIDCASVVSSYIISIDYLEYPCILLQKELRIAAVTIKPYTEPFIAI